LSISAVKSLKKEHVNIVIKFNWELNKKTCNLVRF
jgi:hypothetical protein